MLISRIVNLEDKNELRPSSNFFGDTIEIVIVIYAYEQISHFVKINFLKDEIF